MEIIVDTALDYKLRVHGVDSAIATSATLRLSTERGFNPGNLPTSTVMDETLDTVRESVAGGEDLVAQVSRENRADRGDLSYFHTLKLAESTGSIHAATLNWTHPQYFGLIALTAGKPIPGASGAVEMNGATPESYKVEDGDNLSAIAKRLRIRTVELVYMNPSLGFTDPQILVGDRLNLDPRIRG